MEGEAAHLQANVDRFCGVAEVYDRYRPRPPAALVQLLTQMAGGSRPRLVVDLGSGTGLSTRIWMGHADAVVGVEPNAEMRRQAQQAADRGTGGASIRYAEGRSSGTGLPDGCADIVTVCQALHWMEPESTFAEVARLLRPGGVMAAVDCDWPPTTDWPVMLAYAAVMKRVGALEKQGRDSPNVHKWDKDQHLARMQQSGRFRFVHEVVLHQIEPGDAERIVGIARSQGGVATVLATGVSESELGLEELRRVAHGSWGEGAVSFYFSYRVRLGIK